MFKEYGAFEISADERRSIEREARAEQARYFADLVSRSAQAAVRFFKAVMTTESNSGSTWVPSGTAYRKRLSDMRKTTVPTSLL